MRSKKRSANRKCTKGKKKMWKKGESASFNPKTTKFRDEAKKRGTLCYGNNAKLTEPAVSLHNNANLGSSIANSDDMSDTETIGGKSFASTFTNCANPTFSRLLSRWQSDSTLHKEMLAVLAAVSDVIKAKGGNDTETEYFAALMTTLEIVDTDEARTAVMSLLHLVIKKVPMSVLKANLEKSCTVFKELLIQNIESDFNVLLKHLLECLFYFLNAADVCDWTECTSNIYCILLECTVHQKPKVRKAAQEAVTSLLKKFSDVSGGHPSVKGTIDFCIQKMETSIGLQQTVACHILNLLGNIMHCFPRSSMKLSCETILRAMTLSDAMMISVCFNTLQKLFANKPNHDRLPAILNVQIIKALHEYQPNINDGTPLINWLYLMEAAFINLNRLDSTIFLNHLPNFFKVAVSCWLSEKDEVCDAVSLSLKHILTCEGMSKICLLQSNQNGNTENSIHKIFHTVEETMSYKFHKSWNHVLDVLTTLFDVFGQDFSGIMIQCLQSLSDFRGSYKFPYITQVDKAIGIAIRRMKPETVLTSIPLKLSATSDKPDLSRSWLLPLLRDNIKTTNLSFFTSYFLPLAYQLRKRAKESEANDMKVVAKTYEVLCTQIWSLLPSFCSSPTDLKEAFKNIAKVLGLILNNEPELRITVMSALRNLISCSLENEENEFELAAFAKNYLPILFNLYTTQTQDKASENVRLAVFDTIKAYLQVTPQELCQSMFMKCFEKIEDADSFKKCALMDLMRAIVQYLGTECVTQLFEYCKPLLKDTNHTIQKKAYKTVDDICSSLKKVCQDFVQNNIGDLKELLLTSLSSSASSSKALRLNCLKSIVQHLSEENNEFIRAVVPEATLCTKETSSKARMCAFKLLTTIGEKLKEWKGKKNSDKAFMDYLHMLLVGFEGSPHMISATILAISHLIYTFKGDFNSHLINLLIDNICLLFASQSREIVTSALSFVKVLFSAVSIQDLSGHVEQLVACLSNVSEENQRHFRFKAKELFTRLIRKFGYPMIKNLAPEKFHKQLASIHKLEARKKKKVLGKGFDKDSDTEELVESFDKLSDIFENADNGLDIKSVQHRENRGGKKKLRSAAYMAESAENDIIDFMDSRVNKKVLSCKPGTSTQKKIEPASSFDVSEDGRFIITEEKEVSHQKKKRKREDDTSGNGENSKKNKKQKDISDDDGLLPRSKVISSGIHRNIDVPKFAPGSAFKSKKAAGDIRKGKIDPYAYIPMNRQFLNKRKQKKLKGQFKGIVSSAKRGAVKGSKKKVKFSKKRM